MICKNNECRTELPDDAVFCHKCGAKQDVPETNNNDTSNEKQPTPQKRDTRPLTIILSVIIITFLFILVSYLIDNNSVDNRSNTISTTVPTEFQSETGHYFSLEESLIEVTDVFTSAPNSASGVDLILYWNNNATAEVKYIYIYVTPYNRVGDIESSEIGGKTTAKCRMVGPYNLGDGGRAVFENVWYNNAISSAKVEKIEIEFTNGSFVTFE